MGRPRKNCVLCDERKAVRKCKCGNGLCMVCYGNIYLNSKDIRCPYCREEFEDTLNSYMYKYKNRNSVVNMYYWLFK